jgi:hypothetical protein
MRTPMEKNTTPVSRSLSESLRDAQYACAIQTFKSDAKLTLGFLADALVGFAVVGLGGVICYLIVTML